VLEDESQVIESVAGVSYYDPSPFVAVENGFASDLNGAAVTGDFFRVMGVEPILGRALHPSDDKSGAANVLVITHGLWPRRYGGSRDVIGRRFVVSERPFTIVGVMPPDVECPHGVEAWKPDSLGRNEPGGLGGVRRSTPQNTTAGRSAGAVPCGSPGRG
jgi:hypothetical protein